MGSRRIVFDGSLAPAIDAICQELMRTTRRGGGEQEEQEKSQTKIANGGEAFSDSCTQVSEASRLGKCYRHLSHSGTGSTTGFVKGIANDRGCRFQLASKIKEKTNTETDLEMLEQNIM